MRFANITLWVWDSKKSERFYKRIGFAIEKSDDEHSIVKLGDLKLVLVQMREDDFFARDSMAGEKGKGMYIYIFVDDTDEHHSQLVEAGVETATNPKDWPWGNREFIVKDPDGYKLCFYSPKE